jgi:hypothetical protein
MKFSNFTEEKSMKKIFIALSVLAALTFGVSSALAVGGADDNVPGTDFVVPFLVSYDRVNTGSGPTTYLNLSEVGGLATDYHLHFMNNKSVRFATRTLPFTHFASVMKDIATFILGFSTTEMAGLSTVTIDGVQYYSGYIYGENRVMVLQGGVPVYQRGTNDNVIGSIYLLNLAAGQAAAARLPMKEYYTANLTTQAALTLGGGPLAWNAPTNRQAARWAITGTSAVPYVSGPKAGLMPVEKQYGFLTDTYSNYERFSPVALAAAANLAWTNAVSLSNKIATVGGNTYTWSAPMVAWFRMLPEYYINSATGDTTFILWQNGLGNGADFHFYIFNNEECYADTTIVIDELTFLVASEIVPPALMTGPYPFFGFFNLDLSDSASVSNSTYSYAEFLGWNWQYDDNGGGAAAANWSILKGMARDVGTTGNSPAVPWPTYPNPCN